MDVMTPAILHGTVSPERWPYRLHPDGTTAGNTEMFPSEEGPVVPSFRALFGRLKFTVRRHKFNKDSPPEGTPYSADSGIRSFCRILTKNQSGKHSLSLRRRPP